MKSLAKLVLFFFLIISVCNAIQTRRGDEEYEEEGSKRERKGEEIFLLERAKQVVRTEAGEVRVVRGYAGKEVEKPMHIGFITMEPKSLFIPQYLDSNLIIFVRRGDANIGWIYEDKLVKRRLKTGDLYRIPAGSAFYIVNRDEGQRLQMICSIDTSESMGIGLYQSFFIGGGMNPMSVLAGFDPKTLTMAFNVSSRVLADIMTRQQEGPIVFTNATDEPRKLESFMKVKYREGLEQHCGSDEEDNDACSNMDDQTAWTKFVNFVFGEKNAKKTVTSPDAYNIYDRNPDFKNNYGSSIALDDSDYAPLSHAGIGVYFVNLTAGAMMAPHMNPTATEYGIVLKGAGSIQVVYPNGSSAMNTNVKVGDVFWVPKFFPFCQIASRNGPMEFFGFTTSASKNRPQFLVGASSLLRTMEGPELAMAFGVSEKRFSKLVHAQGESIILPSAAAAPPQMQEEEEHGGAVILENVGRDMVLGFD